MLIFGYATCLDCFMHQFTLLPIRVAFSVCALARSALGGAAARLTPFQVRVRVRLGLGLGLGLGF